MLEGGYGKYEQINTTRIDERLKDFCSDPRVIGLNVPAIDALTTIRVSIDRMKKVEKEDS